MVQNNDSIYCPLEDIKFIRKLINLSDDSNFRDTFKNCKEAKTFAQKLATLLDNILESKGSQKRDINSKKVTTNTYVKNLEATFKYIIENMEEEKLCC